MDTIILAAGANERLRGIVPPYHKPLLLINGRPIISELVRNALRGCSHYDDKVIVVCSPENVRQIMSILPAEAIPHRMRYVIQNEPTGAVNAFALGLELSAADHVLMLCGDNVIEDETMDAFVGKPGPYSLVVGKTRKPRDQAERFTTIWMQDASPEKTRYVFFRGCRDIPQAAREVNCWIGPVIFGREHVQIAVEELQKRFEPRYTVEFHNLFNHMAEEYGEPLFLESHALDIGVPEALS